MYAVNPRTIRDLGSVTPHINADRDRGWWCAKRRGPVGWGKTVKEAYEDWQKAYNKWKAEK